MSRTASLRVGIAYVACHTLGASWSSFATLHTSDGMITPWSSCISWAAGFLTVSALRRCAPSDAQHQRVRIGARCRIRSRLFRAKAVFVPWTIGWLACCVAQAHFHLVHAAGTSPTSPKSAAPSAAPDRGIPCDLCRI
jgi:hypothetical protein